MRTKPLAELFLNKMKLSNLIILLVFPNQDSILFYCFKFMLVQFPPRSCEPIHGTRDLARVLELDTVVNY